MYLPDIRYRSHDRRDSILICGEIQIVIHWPEVSFSNYRKSVDCWCSISFASRMDLAHLPPHLSVWYTRRCQYNTAKPFDIDLSMHTLSNQLNYVQFVFTVPCPPPFLLKHAWRLLTLPAAPLQCVGGLPPKGNECTEVPRGRKPRRTSALRI